MNFFLHRGAMSVSKVCDALARAYGPSWLCNDVTRPFWKNRSSWIGAEREDDMVAIQRGVGAPRSEVADWSIKAASGVPTSLMN
jgi:hypothetical protein